MTPYYATIELQGVEEPTAGTPIPPRPEVAERVAQREAEKIALVLGLPLRRPQPVETPAPAPAVEAPKQPAKRQPRQYGTAADLSKPIDPRAFNLRSRHRSRSCHHGGGQS